MYTGSFPAQSNRADWVFAIEVTDADTGDAVDLTGALITLAVSDQENRKGNVLSGSSTDGKIIINTPATDGIFIVRFTPDLMESLDEDFYDVGIRITYPTGEVVQVVKALMPVVEGVPS